MMRDQNVRICGIYMRLGLKDAQYAQSAIIYTEWVESGWTKQRTIWSILLMHKRKRSNQLRAVFFSLFWPENRA